MKFGLIVNGLTTELQILTKLRIVPTWGREKSILRTTGLKTILYDQMCRMITAHCFFLSVFAVVYRLLPIKCIHKRKHGALVFSKRVWVQNPHSVHHLAGTSLASLKKLVKSNMQDITAMKRTTTHKKIREFGVLSGKNNIFCTMSLYFHPSPSGTPSL